MTTNVMITEPFAMREVIATRKSFIESLIVNSEESYKKVTSLYAEAREWKKAIELRRKELVDPFRKKQASINDIAKELTDPLDAVIDMANGKANGYVRMLEERKRLADEELRQQAALFDAAEEIYIPPMDNIVRGDGAIAVTKTETQFRVVDISKVPVKYLMVDEAAIKKDIKLGISQIDGIEIFETKTTQLRTR